jgi:hypothetical protein
VKALTVGSPLPAILAEPRAPALAPAPATHAPPPPPPPPPLPELGAHRIPPASLERIVASGDSGAFVAIGRALQLAMRAGLSARETGRLATLAGYLGVSYGGINAAAGSPLSDRAAGEGAPALPGEDQAALDAALSRFVDQARGPKYAAVGLRNPALYTARARVGIEFRGRGATHTEMLVDRLAELTRTQTPENLAALKAGIELLRFQLGETEPPSPTQLQAIVELGSRARETGQPVTMAELVGILAPRA